MPIKALTAIDWRDLAAPADVVGAPWMGKLTTKGNKKAGIVGHFQADLVLNGTGATKATLGSAKIAGDLAGVDWRITGPAGKLTVRGTAVGSSVRSTQGIAGVTLGAADGSDFFAGVLDSVDRHPAKASDFGVLTAAIGSFKIKGLKPPKGQQATGRFFSDSNVSAAWIGAVGLLNVNFDNTGTAFGLWACDTTDGNEIKSVKWSDKADKAVKGKWPPKPGEVFHEPDLAIEML